MSYKFYKRIDSLSKNCKNNYNVKHNIICGERLVQF